MLVESARGRIWSPSRLQNAIKAAFFARAVELGKAESLILLRYSDIKRIIGAGEAPVGDKSLSRALRDLTTKGYLTRREAGREVYYRLKIPRADRVAAFAKSDSTGIQSAAQLGGVGDLTEGWAFYGIPDLARARLKVPFRRAALMFQQEIREAMDHVIERVLSKAFQRARSRLTPRELRQVDRALRHILELQLTGATALIRGELGWRNLETIIPGSLAAWKRKLGIPSEVPPIAEGWTDAHSESLAKALGVPPSEVKDLVLVEQRKLERAGPLVVKFFRAQGKREAQKLARELDAIVTSAIALTSVVRA